MAIRIIIGDALTELGSLPAESVHCCVTSPPYYGLRDYGVVGQLGLEPSPDEYVAALVAVFGEVRRVLRREGTLWLNMGDSYAGGGTIGRNDTGSADLARRAEKFGTGVGSGSAVGASGARPRVSGLKTKDLIGIPWLVAFALRADGWWLRQDIIWSKPNPMPESVTDRCTKAHEYLFLLSRSERYWFDAAAIAEDAINAGRIVEYDGSQKNCSVDPVMQRTRITSDRTVGHIRNKRSVWTVATVPFPEAHFATFPPGLIEPCIKAGCPEGGTVLDPFGGAGTTGLVADRLGRNAVLIELNPGYADMSRHRIEDDLPLFVDVSIMAEAAP